MRLRHDVTCEVKSDVQIQARNRSEPADSIFANQKNQNNTVRLRFLLIGRLFFITVRKGLR